MLRLISNLSSHTPQVSVFIYRTNRNERLAVIFYEAISFKLFTGPNLETEISLSNFDVWYVPNVVFFVLVCTYVYGREFTTAL